MSSNFSLSERQMKDMSPSDRNSELLYRLDEKVTLILKRMDDQDGKYAALDVRINALENFRWWFLGVAAVTGVLFNILKEWFLKQ